MGYVRTEVIFAGARYDRSLLRAVTATVNYVAAAFAPGLNPARQTGIFTLLEISR